MICWKIHPPSELCPFCEADRLRAEVERLKFEASKWQSLWQSLSDVNINLNERLSNAQGKPDCRVCQHYRGPKVCTLFSCVDGDRFELDTFTPLWRAEP